MDIIVCLKRVPDTETRVRFSDGSTVIEPEGVKYIVSPYDEFALEAAFRTTEMTEEGQVTVMTLGNEDSQETLRAALAAGADAAVLLRAQGAVTMDGLATAKALAAELETREEQLVLFGVKAGDDDQQQVGPMVATLLDAGQLDPTVINGGIIHAYGSNARMGQGEWMVVEADESDGTFNRLPATIAIVTNIDPEHMDHWGTEEALHKGFYDFVSNIPFYGLAVCCTDDADVQTLVGKITDRRVVTFGFNAQADVRAVNLTYDAGIAHFDIVLPDGRIDGCTLPMPGDHNVSNALAAVAVSRHLGMKFAEIREALAKFGGVNRRFTCVGMWNDVPIIDDYGHHPVEIAAVLKAARQAVKGRVIAVHQPHRYSRLHSLFDDFSNCFNDADAVIIAPVYAAGEQPIEGAAHTDLVSGMKTRGHRNVRAIEGPEELPALVKELAEPGDFGVCLGAGNITQWAYALPKQLEEL